MFWISWHVAFLLRALFIFTLSCAAEATLVLVQRPMSGLENHQCDHRSLMQSQIMTVRTVAGLVADCVINAPTECTTGALQVMQLTT